MADAAEDARPTALYAFWAEPERPMEEEVRLALQAAFPEARLVDELERDGELLWGQVWRFPGIDGEVVVSAEERGEFQDALIVEGVRDPVEREEARRARFLIGVEAPIDPPRAGEVFLLQLQALDAACVPGYPAVYDDDAVVVRSGKMVRELIAGGVPPGPSALFAIHELDGAHGAWVHTHGLLRLGLPELELWGVDASDKPEAADLLTAIVDAVSAGAETDEDRVLAVGDGVEVRLASVDEALKLMPADAAASRREHADDEPTDGDHDGERCCVVAKERFETPYEVFDRLADDAALFKSRVESERRRRLAIDRFGVFGQLFVLRRNEGWRFHAKLAFATAEADASREHLWFEVLALKPGRLKGACLNAPVQTTAVRRGDEDWFDLDLLTDWVIVAPEGRYDPEAAGVLLADD
jgi:hypothetical protein